jgi:hypothetical protein
MSDIKESSGVEQPPLDPDELLRRLEALIRDKSEPIGEKAGLDISAPRVSKSWIWAIIIPIIVLIGITAYSWFAFRRGRELARLRHEKVKANLLTAQAEIDRKVDEGNLTIAEAEKKIAAARERLRVIEANIKVEEARYEADHRAIDRMRGWDGSYVRKG